MGHRRTAVAIAQIILMGDGPQSVGLGIPAGQDGADTGCGTGIFGPQSDDLGMGDWRPEDDRGQALRREEISCEAPLATQEPAIFPAKRGFPESPLPGHFMDP